MGTGYFNLSVVGDGKKHENLGHRQTHQNKNNPFFAFALNKENQDLSCFQVTPIRKISLQILVPPERLFGVFLKIHPNLIIRSSLSLL